MTLLSHGITGSADVRLLAMWRKLGNEIEAIFVGILLFPAKALLTGLSTCKVHHAKVHFHDQQEIGASFHPF
jgi:hypothetical protein